MPTQKNSASWDLQLGFNLAFKRLMHIWHTLGKYEHLITTYTFFSKGLQQLNITNNYAMFTTFLGTK